MYTSVALGKHSHCGGTITTIHFQKFLTIPHRDSVFLKYYLFYEYSQAHSGCIKELLKSWRKNYKN